MIKICVVKDWEYSEIILKMYRCNINTILIYKNYRAKLKLLHIQ